MFFDHAALEIQCPQCAFWNPVLYCQVVQRDVTICRGCKINIQLDDHLNVARRAQRDIERGVATLAADFKNLSRRLKW